MQVNSEQFVSEYAEALTSFDVKKVAGLYLLPTIIMSDQGKTVMTTEKELTVTLTQMLDYFKKAGVMKFVPTLQQTMRLSDTLFFSKLHWQFFDENNKLCFGYSTSYTLQKMPDGKLQIIVMVIDDEKARTIHLHE